jgi:hypothetical protein
MREVGVRRVELMVKLMPSNANAYRNGMPKRRVGALPFQVADTWMRGKVDLRLAHVFEMRTARSPRKRSSRDGDSRVGDRYEGRQQAGG